MSNNKNGWEGELTIQFLKQVGDLFYYKVLIEYKKEKIEFVLPRYAPMVGWIEIFGLPPQNEWVVLDGNDYSKKQTSDFVIIQNGKKSIIKENLSISTDDKNGWRLIDYKRKLGGIYENQTCFEDWSTFETTGKIEKRMLFKHSEGEYFVTLTGIKNPDNSLLSKQQQKYSQKVTQKQGKSSEVWLKQFNVHGNPLPIYNKIFPFWKHLWKQSQGSIIEIGYEKEMSHGDWYKLFEAGNEVYEIFEDNFTSLDVIYKGKKIKIKDTYR